MRCPFFSNLPFHCVQRSGSAASKTKLAKEKKKEETCHRESYRTAAKYVRFYQAHVCISFPLWMLFTKKPQLKYLLVSEAISKRFSKGQYRTPSLIVLWNERTEMVQLRLEQRGEIYEKGGCNLRRRKVDYITENVYNWFQLLQ